VGGVSVIGGLIGIIFDIPFGACGGNPAGNEHAHPTQGTKDNEVSVSDCLPRAWFDKVQLRRNAHVFGRFAGLFLVSVHLGVDLNHP
jgi:hypothetical protein